VTEGPPEDVPLGIPVEIPSAILRQIRAEHERAHMAAESRENEVSEFLDSLTVPQLLALRTILNMDNRSPMNNFHDGQAVSILRCVHGVDPLSGLSPAEQLAASITSTSPGEAGGNP